MQEKKTDKWIVFVALALIAGVAGNFMNDNPSAVAVENRACISQEYLDMFSEMNIEGEPIVLLANDDIMESARAYSANIGLPYEVTLINQPWEVAQQFYDARLALVHGQMQNPLNCLGNITVTARAYQCNYLVLPIEADDRSAMEQARIQIKYEGYLQREMAQIKSARAMEEALLPPDVDYNSLSSLRLEARQKLNETRPLSLGQASRIPGVSPADIAVLTVWLKRQQM